MAEIRILNGSNTRLRSLLGNLADQVEVCRGDTIVTCETEEEITVGREVFEALITQGYAGFAIQPETNESQRIEKWDPEASPFVIMVSPLVGG